MNKLSRQIRANNRNQAITAMNTGIANMEAQRREKDTAKRRQEAETWLYALVSGAQMPDPGPDPMTIPKSRKLPKEQRPHRFREIMAYEQDRTWRRQHRDDWVFWSRLHTDVKSGRLSRDGAVEVVKARLSSL